ncbi:hypothetical protein [Sinorhizobium chiapasense]|uniref:DUF2946 domain-containing protein n=1 Tax=Sinorhizobium chiapasense TaxID=501572 RepID=A0ABZ2BHU3_9HYPH
MGQTTWRCARGLLAILVAITFLAAPMAEATPSPCDNYAAQLEHSEASPDLTHSGDHHPGDHKACCHSACNWCSIVLPAANSVVLSLDANGQRHLDPQSSITGVTSPPALGPPRSHA